MEFFNKGLAQINDLFKSMTPGARITAGLLLAVVVVSLGYLFNQQYQGGGVYLLGGQSFTSSELTGMEAAFGKAGLSNYDLQGSRVRIPHGQQALYMAALADAGALPAHFGSYLDEALSGDNPWTSAKQREERLKIAKQQELALIIRSMQGIDNAAVHYDIKRGSGFRGDELVTASISVKPQGTTQLEARQVPMIRHLVASAIAGLTPERVTVVDLNGRTYSGGGSIDGLPSSIDDPYMARMKEHQVNFEGMINSALSYVRGATVSVHVELNKELRHVEDREQVDPKSVAPLFTRTDSNSSTSQSPTIGGQPGFAAQGPNTSARLASSSGANSNDSQESSEIQNAVGRDRTHVALAPLTLKRVTVAVGVPSNYFERIWQQRNPAADGQPPAKPDTAALEQIQREEMEKIRQHVAGILPPPADPAISPLSLVTVTAFEHLAEHLVEPSIADRALGWFGDSWSTLSMVGLAAFSLVMLRSFVRSTPPSEPFSAALPSVDLAADDEPLAPSGKAGPRLKRRSPSGVSMRDELVEIVREDPDAAANILRTWIGKAG